MAKTITIRLDSETYQRIKKYAEAERRSISGFIENATIAYIEESSFADELEMMEIMSNKELLSRLKKGSTEVGKRNGKLIGWRCRVARVCFG